MAGYQPARISETKRREEIQKLGDWLAPLIACFAIVAMLLPFIRIGRVRTSKVHRRGRKIAAAASASNFENIPVG